MTTNDFDPESREAREAAAEAATDNSEFFSLVQQYYRGEMSQSATFLDRLDLTVDWAIAVVTAVLALAFESTGRSSHLLLIGMIAMVMFLWFDIRRYRTYDAVRARVRLIEENVFANTFDPKDVPMEDWREEIGEDLRNPQLKVSYREALSRRLARVYFPLFVLLGVAWLFRISVFAPGPSFFQSAAVPGVPGEFVVAAVGVFYAALVSITFWPHKRQAKGEFRGQEPGAWKKS
ncbi:DUF2270 domain-containing protein [Halegenticoccus tardaugens]|uniref:DUF2270 domain-containing protein n=1 Tax=Halegenticoccus tardaugens TaxID=2071624 RepID=UPI00100AD7DD|nr:DUF2270 domain-containing protein [Halegenticoccus tardaugens]